MDKSKIEKLNPQEYTHLPHEAQHFEDHEQTDVAIRPLVWTLVALAVVLAITGVGMWGLFEVLKRTSDDAPDNQMMSAVETESIGPRTGPEGFPPLQGILSRDGNPNSAAQDMKDMRDETEKQLAGHAPMREGMKPGVAIERAIDEALARGIFKTAPRGGGGASGSGASGAATRPAAGAGEAR
jgi:hypothetical protein